jgi:hypothetical protein
LLQISMFFGPLMTTGMILGIAVGGYLANRLARVSPSRPLLISVCVNIVIPPVFWLTLLVPSSSVALGLTFVTGFLAVSHAPIYAAAVQNCCRGVVRSSASAVMVLMNSVIGMGLLPFFVGILSDVGTHAFGDNSLRYSLVFMISVNFVAAFMFFKAYASNAPVET